MTVRPFKKPAYMLKNAGRTHPLWAQLILFAGLFFLMAFAEALVLLIIYTLFPASESGPGAADLYSTIGSALTVYLFARFWEKRSRDALSLRLAKKTSFLTEYGAGLLAGAALFTLALFVSVVPGAARVSLGAEKVSLGTLLLFFLGFAIQSFEEELLCRGYMLSALMGYCSVPVAVGLSSVLFAALHLLNSGISFIAFVNLILFGVLTALVTLRRGSLWAACGLHCAWNFVQGNIFGSAVSGLNLGPSVFATAFSPEKAILNGGSFGAEGGLAVTLVMGIGIFYAIVFMEQKN